MLSSSLGRKLVMSLTGLFLVVFLLVHLSGNLLLFKEDGGAAFNHYGHFMATSPLIRVLEIGLFAGIIFHFLEGVSLIRRNQKSRPLAYAQKSASTATWASRSMGLLGGTITLFIIIHLADFFYKSRLATPEPGVINVIDADGTRDLYSAARESFSAGWYTGLYVLFMVGLGFHLFHGFQSAFRTLGLSHRGYALLIRRVGALYAIAVPLGFASIPVYFFVKSLN